MFTKSLFKYSAFFVVVLLMLVSACTKDKIDLPYETLQLPDAELELRGIAFSDDMHGWIACGKTWYRGGIMRTEDGGLNWTFDSLDYNDIYCVKANGEYIYACGFSHKLHISADSGHTWTTHTLPGGSERINSVDFRTPQQGIACGGINYGSGCFYSFDNSAGVVSTAQDSLLNELLDICWVNDQTAIAVGYGIVMRTTDGGQHWAPDGIDGDMFRAVHFPSPQTGFAAGYYGSIIKTTDGGQSWRKCRNGSSLFVSDEHFRDICFADEQTGFVVGDGGLVWRTTDGGENWSIVDNVPVMDYYSVFIQGAYVYIGGSSGKLLRIAL